MDILPTDIICRILYFAVSDKSTDLNGWKESLPLLAINHEWRANAARRIYRIVLIFCTAPENYQIDLNTNITLVEQNGYLDSIKWLGISDFTYDYQVEVLQHIAEALPAQFDALKYIFKEAGEATDDQLAHCYQAAENIAKSFVRHLPNINHLTIHTYYPHPIYLTFVNTLVESYGGQLVDLACTMPANFSSSLYADNLDNLDLFLRAKLDDIIFDNIKPTIKPQSLKQAKLVTQDIPFTWDLFIQDADSDTLSFDNLKDLKVVGDRFLEYELRDEQIRAIDKVWPKLAFPQLTDLTIHELPLTDDAVEALMSAPLKTLSYQGQSAQARLLCRHKISSLNELTMDFDMYIETSIDDFYRFSNDIFNRTSEIPIVQCSIYDQEYRVDWSQIDWPHVTHLSIYNLSNLGKFLDAITAVPNLVQLLLVVYFNGETDAALLVATLNGLKQTYTQPSSSKIEKLIISLVGIDEALDQELEELKWYLPKLEQIVRY